MNSTVSATAPGQDSFWWQGSLMTIKARAADTGGMLGMAEASFPEGFGPPLHVHHREDEAIYVLEGQIRFRQGEQEFVAGPGTFVWGPRGIPHAFKVEPGGARALVIVTPGGFEEMFAVGGISAAEFVEAPVVQYDPAAAAALAGRFGFEVVGPQLG
jgi:quercetin dioxygenase-like cupin family protein